MNKPSQTLITANNHVTELVKEVSNEDLSKASGISKNNLSSWKNKNSPYPYQIGKLEQILKAVDREFCEIKTRRVK